jgi:hypothetical protein
LLVHTRFLIVFKSQIDVSHYLDMVGVTGSIPVAPTIKAPEMATPRRVRLHARFGNPHPEFNSELAAHDFQLGNVLDRLDNPLGQT